MKRYVIYLLYRTDTRRGFHVGWATDTKVALTQHLEDVDGNFILRHNIHECHTNGGLVQLIPLAAVMGELNDASVLCYAFQYLINDQVPLANSVTLTPIQFSNYMSRLKPFVVTREGRIVVDQLDNHDFAALVKEGIVSEPVVHEIDTVPDVGATPERVEIKERLVAERNKQMMKVFNQ